MPPGLEKKRPIYGNKPGWGSPGSRPDWDKPMPIPEWEDGFNQRHGWPGPRGQEGSWDPKKRIGMMDEWKDKGELLGYLSNTQGTPEYPQTAGPDPVENVPQYPLDMMADANQMQADFPQYDFMNGDYGPADYNYADVLQQKADSRQNKIDQMNQLRAEKNAAKTMRQDQKFGTFDQSGQYVPTDRQAMQDTRKQGKFGTFDQQGQYMAPTKRKFY
jgi:hypothetical protein